MDQTRFRPAFFLFGLLLVSGFALSCGSSSSSGAMGQLQSITLTPAAADAQNFPNGQSAVPRDFWNLCESAAHGDSAVGPLGCVPTECARQRRLRQQRWRCAMWERSGGHIHGVCLRYDELHGDQLVRWRMHRRRNRAADVPLNGGTARPLPRRARSIRRNAWNKSFLALFVRDLCVLFNRQTDRVRQCPMRQQDACKQRILEELNLEDSCPFAPSRLRDREASFPYQGVSLSEFILDRGRARLLNPKECDEPLKFVAMTFASSSTIDPTETRLTNLPE